ncbi:MAG TPA: regulatory protein RecX [candidate division Zixibacteria bacterium]|nr:regulatory protein RecX [candidate division Zixibacteria bacterium]
MPQLMEKKKSRGAVTLTFDNNTVVTLRSRDLRHENFQEGAEYDAARIDQLRYEVELERADTYLTAKLSRNLCSIGQARQALKQKGFNAEISREIVARFKRAGFLDDGRFAEGFVRAALANRPAGRAFLQAALQKKLVAPEVAQAVIDAAFAETDEVELAVALLRKRWWRLSQLDLESARQKGYTFLAQRAIGYQASKEAFERLAAEEPSFAEEIR